MSFFISISMINNAFIFFTNDQHEIFKFDMKLYIAYL